MDRILNGLRGAGERTRLRLLFILSHGELNVKELTQILSQSQPRVSRHLKLLCEAGLLTRYREGSWVLFRLAESGREAALARMIVDLLPGSDAALQRDLLRLSEVRELKAQAAQEYFRTNASDWDMIRSLHISEGKVEDAMAEVLGDKHFDTFVDLGTGTGRILELFSDRFANGIGIDMNPEMLALARSTLDKPDLRHCQVRQGDMFNLPYDNNMADVVVIHQVLHFVEDPQKAIAEAARILKPNGLMLIVDFAPHELEFLRETYAHRRLGIEADQLKNWISSVGLDISRSLDLKPVETGSQHSEASQLTVSLWLLTNGKAQLPHVIDGESVEEI